MALKEGEVKLTMEAMLTTNEFLLGRSILQTEAPLPCSVRPPKMFTSQNNTGLGGHTVKGEKLNEIVMSNSTTEALKMAL